MMTLSQLVAAPRAIPTLTANSLPRSLTSTLTRTFTSNSGNVQARKSHSFLNRFKRSCIAPAVFSIISSPGAFAALMPNDLIITEVMANPAAVSDSVGEWFEIYNSTSVSIDLGGLVLRDEGSNSHTINAESNAIVAAGGYFVLGRNPDFSLNGGVPTNYSYSNFSLSNSSDSIVLEFDSVIISSINYGSGSVFGAAGISAEWVGDHFQLTPSSYLYGNGDVGTPGFQGSTTAPLPPVPIPAAGWLFGSALAGLLIKRRK